MTGVLFSPLVTVTKGEFVAFLVNKWLSIIIKVKTGNSLKRGKTVGVPTFVFLLKHENQRIHTVIFPA